MYTYNRKKKREVNVGNRVIGGDHPILIQSMTNTKTEDVKATVRQIQELEKEGCEIIRVAVPNQEAAKSIDKIKESISIPLVADIHFDYRLAIEVMERGIDKLRINPGNIGDEERIKKVVETAKKKKIPIRIGVNAGSLQKEIFEKFGGATPDGLVESALRHIHILEKYDFYDIVVSIKASNIPLCTEAYSALADEIEYPLHVGITEAGTLQKGIIKSAVGIGTILSLGIGDTLRVSLTGDPLEEIDCAKKILQSLGLRQFGPEIISCPTCGRTRINLIQLANEVEKRCKNIKKPIKIAVMGCEVNGPGEAREADIGIAGGNGVGLIFKKGQIIKKVPENQLLNALFEEINKLN